MAYQFKLDSRIAPRSGIWDVNGGLLRWIDKEIILKRLTAHVLQVRIIIMVLERVAIFDDIAAIRFPCRQISLIN